MTDIVERLRIMDAEADSSHLRMDAIDEVERLRQQLADSETIRRALAEDVRVVSESLAAAERDAARYRWLRVRLTRFDVRDASIVQPLVSEEEDKESVAIDAAIDALLVRKEG